MLNRGDKYQILWHLTSERPRKLELIGILSFGEEENHYKQCFLPTIHGVVYHDQWYHNLLRHQVRPGQLHFHCLVLIIDQSLKFQVHLVLIIIGIDINFVLLIKNG